MCWRTAAPYRATCRSWSVGAGAAPARPVLRHLAGCAAAPGAAGGPRGRCRPQSRRGHAHLRAFQPALVPSMSSLSRRLSCALVEGGDLDGARRRAVPEDAAWPAAGGCAAAPGGWADTDPLEGDQSPAHGVAGLLDAVRGGTVRIVKRPSAPASPRRRRSPPSARPRAAPAGRGVAPRRRPHALGGRSGGAGAGRGRISAAGWCAARWTARCARSPPPPCRRRHGLELAQRILAAPKGLCGLRPHARPRSRPVPGRRGWSRGRPSGALPGA